MIKLILCAAAALNLASAQYNGIIWDAQPQYQPEYNQPVYPQIHSNDKNREAAEEPIVGSPLLPIIPPLNPFGLHGLSGIPGLRFSNLNAGRFGSLLYGNTLLGSPNPMADDQAEAQYQPNADQQLASPYQTAEYQAAEYQADPQISAQHGPASIGHGGHWWWKKWANDDQSASMVGASPCSCAQSNQNYQVTSPQSYSGYEATPQNYQSPQNYEVASPQNYQAYPQQIYSPYQSQLPQIISDFQPYQAQEHRAQYDYQQVQPQAAGPIIQPAGTYESSSSEKSAADSNADERSWDWSWKDDKKAAIKDKFYSKKDKFNKGGHAHVHVHPAPQYHQPQYYYQPSYPVYTKPVYTKPVYTKPAPAQPVQYNNYYNAYRSRNSEAEQPLDSEVKSEVGQSQDLKITTTEASSNKTSTTISCYSPNELTTKSTTTTDEKSAIAVSTTTEKSKKKNDDKSKKSSRRRRDVPKPSTNNKRCITFTDPIFLGVPFSSGIPLLGAPNPNAAAEDDSTQDLVSNPSENCESGDCSNPTDPPQPVTTTQPPPSRFFGNLGPDRTQQLFRALGTEPYLGAVQQESNKLWTNDGVIGRIMGPLEDTYLDFVKHNENLPRIQDIRVIT